MPGASDQTQPVKVLNANWVPDPNGGDGRFQMMIITEDGSRNTLATTPTSVTRWRIPDLSTDQQTAARQVLTDLGLTPHALARRTRPVSFIDVVSHGSTFTELFDLLDD